MRILLKMVAQCWKPRQPESGLQCKAAIVLRASSAESVGAGGADNCSNGICPQFAIRCSRHNSNPHTHCKGLLRPQALTAGAGRKSVILGAGQGRIGFVNATV
jgi:hypothetical protein